MTQSQLLCYNSNFTPNVMLSFDINPLIIDVAS